METSNATMAHGTALEIGRRVGAGPRLTHFSPSRLPQDARAILVSELNQRLADGIDLHSQIKVAHWNVKGPYFASLHPLFEEMATGLSGYVDAIAERAVTLGGQAFGTVRTAARRSAVSDYDETLADGLAHVAALSERFDQFLDGLRSTRQRAESLGDADTVDLLTELIGAFEKHGWFLRATMGAR